MFRTCAKCKTEKTKEDFYKNKSEPLGISYTCKPCARQYNLDWKTKNPGKNNIATKKWSIRNPDKKYTHKLKRDYNITLEQFNALLKGQNFLCCICSVEIEKPYIAKKLGIKTAHVDHDHKTGKIRSLLCDLCNKGLGFFKDDCNLLKNAIKYLINNQSGSNNV